MNFFSMMYKHTFNIDKSGVGHLHIVKYVLPVNQSKQQTQVYLKNVFFPKIVT